jgi:hypothetical protein
MVAFGLPGMAATNVTTGIPVAARSGTYELYVCTGCGLQYSVEFSKLGSEPSRREVSFHQTSVSRAIGTNDCRHDWLLYVCGRIDGGERARTELPGGRAESFNIYALLASPTFAGELAAMDRPREKWKLLVIALSTDWNLDRSLDEWSTALPHRSFSSWWEQSRLAKTNSR